MTHLFHPDAAAEFEEAVNYDGVGGTNLGARFASEIRKTIDIAIEVKVCIK